MRTISSRCGKGPDYVRPSQRALALGCWGLAGGMDHWVSSIHQLSPTPEAGTPQLQMLWASLCHHGPHLAIYQHFTENHTQP